MITEVDEKKEINEIVSRCEQFRQQLVSYCFHYDCTAEEAEDCVSFAYEKLIVYLDKGEEIVNPRAWLYKVAINNVRTLEKQKAKEKLFEFEDNEQQEKALERLSVNVDYVEDLVSEETVKRCAVKILSLLDSDERKLYILYYRQGKRLNEISKILGLSEANVRKRKQRLKKKLEQLVKTYSEDLYEFKNISKGGEQ